MVNYLNICLKLPNVGLVTFYLVFVLLIPMFIINFSTQGTGFLKYYFPILVAFANLLTLSGSPYIFQNLYVLQPKNVASTISTWLINIIALAGIIWQTLEYSKYEINIGKDPNIAIFYGLTLMGITFLVSTVLFKSFLEQIDKWSNRNTSTREKGQLKSNWHRLIFGLMFIVLIIGLEVLLLGMLNQMNPGLGTEKSVDILGSVKSSFTISNNNNNNASAKASMKPSVSVRASNNRRN